MKEIDLWASGKRDADGSLKPNQDPGGANSNQDSAGGNLGPPKPDQGQGGALSDQDPIGDGAGPQGPDPAPRHEQDTVRGGEADSQGQPSAKEQWAEDDEDAS